MSVGEAIVWCVDGSACVRLLDVTLLDGELRTVVTSWLRERERERAIREKHLGFFQRRDGDVTLRVIRTSWLWQNPHVHTQKHRKVYRTYVKRAPCSHFNIYNRVKKVII